MTFKGVGVAISAKARHFVIAVMIGLGVVVPSQPASAQNILLDFATASLNTLFNRSSNPNNNRQLPPQPVPNSNSTFGTGNMNGNNINFCVFPCVPNGTSPAASRFVPTIPSGIVPNRGIVTQQRIGLPPGVAPNRGIPTQRPTGLPPGTVTQQPNRLPPGVVPNRNIPTQQPNPRQNRPRPTIIIPPITLPFSL